MRKFISGKMLYLITGIIIISAAGCDFRDLIGDRDNPDDPWGDNYHVTIKGFVQKGPFCSGSTITIQGMNESFQPDGELIQTTTLNDTGGFSVEVAFQTKIVEVSASGYYFNEVSGLLSESQLVLKSLVDLTTVNNANVNINILTTLCGERIKYLCGTGMSFADAKNQAVTDILSVFHIPSTNVSDFNLMDISSNSESNAILLAVSSILQQNNSVAHMSELISQVGLDISGDGTLDNGTLASKLLYNSAAVDPEQIRHNLLLRYTYLGLQNLTIPEFVDYIDSDGDGLINSKDFVVSFNPVTDVEINTDVISNEITIVLPDEIMEATVSVDSGTVVKNGIDTGAASVNMVDGDRVAVKAQSSANRLTSINLRMVVSYGPYTNSGYFQVTTAQYSDEDCVKMDKEALDIIYTGGDSASRVMNNIKLLMTGPYKTAINWSSSDTDIVSDSGQVTRPLREEGDALINLTATITKGGYSGIKEFTINVKHGYYIYVSTAGGFYISKNNGRSLTRYSYTNGLGSSVCGDLSVVGSNIYVVNPDFSFVDPSYIGGVSVSTDDGVHWAYYTVANGLGSKEVNAIFAVGSMVYAATDGGVSISADKGVHWINYTTANGLGSNGVSDVFASESTVYAATDGGVSISADNGVHWVNYTTANGLGNNYIKKVKAVGSMVYAVNSAGFSISVDNGVHWNNYTTADGLASNNIADIFVSESIVYVLTYNGISISTDNGVHYTTSSTQGFPSSSAGSLFVIDSSIYVGTVGSGIWVSTDNGSSWSTIIPDPQGGSGSMANMIGDISVQ